MSDLVSNMKKAANAARKAAVLLEASTMVFRTDQPNVQRVMNSKSSMGLALSNLYSKGGQFGQVPETEFAPNVERVIRSRSSVGRGLTDIYSKNNERQAAIEADKKQQKIEIETTKKSQKSLEKIEKSQVDMLKVTRGHNKKVEKFQEESESVWKKMSDKLVSSQKDKRLGSMSGGWTAGLGLMRLALGGDKDTAIGAAFNSLPDNVKQPLEGIQNQLREKMGKENYEGLKGGLTAATALSAVGLDPAKISAMLVGFFQDSSFLGKILGGLGLAVGAGSLLEIMGSKEPLKLISDKFNTVVTSITAASTSIVKFFDALMKSRLAKRLGFGEEEKTEEKKEGAAAAAATPEQIKQYQVDILDNVMTDRSGAEISNSQGGRLNPTGAPDLPQEFRPRLTMESGAMLGFTGAGLAGSMMFNPLTAGIGALGGGLIGGAVGLADEAGLLPENLPFLGDTTKFTGPNTGHDPEQLSKALEAYLLKERIKAQNQELLDNPDMGFDAIRKGKEDARIKRMEQQSKNKSSSNVTVVGGPQTTVVQGGGNQGSGTGSYAGSTAPSGTANRWHDDMLSNNAQMSFYP